MASGIFDHILSYLDNNDLLSALLVNRYWCSLAIPRLWKDPFPISHFIENGATVRRQQERLISTCLAFMPIETKRNLGITFPKSSRTRKLLSKLARLFPKRFKSKPFKHRDSEMPKFPYLTLIRTLRLEDTVNALWSWFNANLAFHSTDTFWPILSALWTLIIERNIYLEHVSIDISLNRPNRPQFDLLTLNFRQEQESIHRIVQTVLSHYHLQSLELSEVPETLYVLQDISKNSLGLKHLTILESDSHIRVDQLIPIIYALKKLCTFELTRCNNRTREDEDLSNLIHALGTRELLTRVVLVGGVIKDNSALTSLFNLNNLQSLRLEDNISTAESLRPLSLFRFSNLKDLTLILKNSTAFEPYNDIYTEIFKVNGAQLTRLELILPPQINQSEILLSISDNCKSLQKLTVRVSKMEEAKALLTILGNCPHLHSLDIPENPQPLISDIIFSHLCTNFPSSLKKLRLKGWTLSQRVLVNFFEQCHAKLDFLEIKLKDTNGESDDIILSSLMYGRSFKKFVITLSRGNQGNVIFYFWDPLLHRYFVW